MPITRVRPQRCRLAMRRGTGMTRRQSGQAIETSGPPESEAGGILSIDLSALVANWRELGARAAGAECAAVVKADGYGCGLAPVSAALAAADLRPVIGSLGELAEWEAFRAASGWRGGAALHVDTGMNRLGLAPEQAAEIAGRNARRSDILLLMSHFACAEEPSHPLNARQMAEFRELRALFPDIP